jgi:hypothetical protein
MRRRRILVKSESVKGDERRSAREGDLAGGGIGPMKVLPQKAGSKRGIEKGEQVENQKEEQDLGRSTNKPPATRR